MSSAHQTLSLLTMSTAGASGTSGNATASGAPAASNSIAPVNSIGAAAFPSPSDRKAPRFRGKHVEDFVQEIDCLAAMHSVPSTELPKACVRYMSKRVKQIISDEPAFKGTDWAAVCTRLRSLFGTATGSHRCSPTKLRKFVDECQRDNPINSEATLDSYWREFLWHLGTMVTDGRMTENERNLLFFSGLPKRLRRAILPALELACRSRNVTFSREAPATLDETLVAARSHLKALAVNAISDSESDDSKKHNRSRHRRRGKRRSSSASSSSSSETDSVSSSSSDSDSDSDSDQSSRKHSSKKGRSKSLSKSKHWKLHTRMDSHSDSDLSALRREFKKKIRGLQKDIRSQEAQLPQPIAPVAFPQPPNAQFPHLAGPVSRQPVYPFPQYVHASTGSANLVPQHQYPAPPAPPYPYRAPVAHPYQGNPGPGYPRRCHMCGATEGVDLSHPLNLRSCPDVLRLTNEGTLKFHPNTGRLTYADGTELPPFHLFPNGWITLFPPVPSARDAPPHMPVAGCASLGAYFDDMPLSVSYSADVASFSSLPVLTRSQAKARPESSQKNVRFEEDILRPKDLSTTEPVRPLVTSKPSTSPPPINTETGWHQEQRNKRRATVEDGKEDDPTPATSRQHLVRIPPRTPAVKFTSDIQESVSFDDIQGEILGAKVTLTLREVIAMAPTLQKRLAGLVKTRREYDHKATSASVLSLGTTSPDSDANTRAKPAPTVTFKTDRALPDDTIRQLAEFVSEGSTDANFEAEISFVEGQEQLSELLHRYAASIALGQPRKFAMISGFVTLIFGDQKAIFLIDSGSELNIVNRTLWKRTSLEMDPDGSRWSLRGIGGEFVPLLGCVVNAPVQLQGKNFDHHFFVSATPGSSTHEGILGQPWLSHFSAQINYVQGGDVELTVFPTGIKTGPSVSLSIASSGHPRNADRLLLTGRAELPKKDF